MHGSLMGRDTQVLVQHEELLAAVPHRVLAEVVDEEGYRGWLSVAIPGWDRQLMPTLVSDEHFHAAPGTASLYFAHLCPRAAVCWATCVNSTTMDSLGWSSSPSDAPTS